KPYFPLRTKKKAVQFVATGLLSEEEACNKFSISLKLLHEWQRWYDRYFVQPYQNPDAMATKKLTDKEKIKLLERQLKESQQQAKYEKLKREAYETMINIAEEEFNIQIEKKRGAGRPAPDSPKNEAQIPF
ncbi:DUF1153 domain-containing protein, partial [Catalinimonas sp. 4WD22]|uniref:DUF1153 domain-containing protein n=1 Tax=Catalinimonas locisalis TaxID=3133978 RepID=UPI003101934E